MLGDIGRTGDCENPIKDRNHMEEAEPSSTALHRITLSGLTTVIAELERRIPAQCAFFTQLMRESWQPEDSLAERAGFALPVPREISR